MNRKYSLLLSLLAMHKRPLLRNHRGLWSNDLMIQIPRTVWIRKTKHAVSGVGQRSDNAASSRFKHQCQVYKQNALSLSLNFQPRLTQCVQVGIAVVEVIAQVHVRLSRVLLLILPRHRVTMAEDEVDLVAFTTFIWSKHDGVRSGIVELALTWNQREE